MNEPKTFTRRPTTIEAIQWTGDNLTAVEDFTNTSDTPGVKMFGGDLFLYVTANHRWLPLVGGEWIAKDGLGFYPIHDEDGHPMNYEAAQ